MAHGLKLDAVVAEIAQHLPGWKHDTTNDHGVWQYLDGSKGTRLSFCFKKDKLEVHAWFINDGGTMYPKNGRDQVPVISVNPTRSPAVIAQDIQRRVIAPYLPLYEVGLKERAEDQDYEKRWDALANELAALVNDATHKPGDHTITRYIINPFNQQKIYLEMRVNSPDSVDFKLNSIPAGLVRDLLLIFNKMPPEQRV